MTSVLVVDDQALVRAGFRMILEAQEDIEIVGEAENGRDALTQSRELRPDVVLMDIRMPVLDGIAASPRDRRGAPSQPGPRADHIRRRKDRV